MKATKFVALFPVQARAGDTGPAIRGAIQGPEGIALWYVPGGNWEVAACYPVGDALIVRLECDEEHPR